MKLLKDHIWWEGALPVKTAQTQHLFSTGDTGLGSNFDLSSRNAQYGRWLPEYVRS